MRAFVRWFEPAMDVDTILYRQYSMVGGAEVNKLHQLIFDLLSLRSLPGAENCGLILLLYTDL